MLDYLFHSGRWPIALDIGTDSIKMLQMRCGGGGLAVCASARWRLPADVPRTGEAWRQLVIGAVREMYQSGGFRGRRVITALSCDQLKIKNVRLPSLSPRELEEAVRWEAKDRFGVDFEPDQLHYLQAGQIRQGTETFYEVILLAAPREEVESHYAMLEAMGLRPEHIDAEPLAVFRPFERHLRRRADENAISVIVDIGHSGTKVIVARGREIVLIKKIDIGGRKLAEAVAKQLNLSLEEAGDLRTQIMREQARPGPESQPDLPKPDPNSVSWTILDAVRGEVEDLAKEISLCLRYCSVTFRGLRPRQVTLTGGQVYDPAMVRLLSEQLGVECQVGQPLKGVDTSAVDMGADRRGVLAEWGLCAGLAFRCAEFERNTRKNENERDRLSA
jgi:type IV pilus assembly protein PilM